LEIIVVDDGSSDATPLLAREMARLHPQIRVIQQRNQGVAAARNLGLAASRGHFIAPVDADDIWLPEAAERLVNCLRASAASVGVAYGWSVTIDEFGQLDGGFRCSMIQGHVLGTLLCHNFLGNASSTMIRRTCLEQVGGYDPQFRAHGVQGCEDWDLYLRIAEQFQFRVVPEFLVGYRRPAGSMSSDASSMVNSHRLLLQRIGQRHRRIPRFLYQLSASSLATHLAHECHRRRQPGESFRWLWHAFVQGPLFTLLRPNCYALAARIALDSFVRSPGRKTSQRDGGSRQFNARILMKATVPAIAELRAHQRRQIGRKIRIQNLLHRVVSWLAIG
jgi:glycosyltransferase involved in cell wall biosynthesis